MTFLQGSIVKQAVTDSDHRFPASKARIRKHIILTGILQGIGCRPTVYRLATRLGLAGWVVNTTSGVRIEIEGTSDQCGCFLQELPDMIPFPGRIEHTKTHDVLPLGEVEFRIETSQEGERTMTPIPPDVAMCPECAREMLDPTNRRYLYPFTTCTLCGPRFTVVRSFPYDRERTSMADFTMCARCRQEYETPDDRRFHSQTNSCSECGPRLSIVSSSGERIEADPVLEAARLLKRGHIVAIKGIGGFHLACDALREDAVRVLRDRKGRSEKPFAVMMPNLSTVRRYCRVNAVEEELLTSPLAPIILLVAEGERTAPNVAPFVGTLGVMLPYSPVHHLLFKHPEIPPEQRLNVLVMTSGNRSEEPIARGNDEARERLRDLVDAFLVHDREIVLRADDSIFRVIGDCPTVFRRSRGMVPGELKLPHGWRSARKSGSAPEGAGPVVLGAGGDLKNALAVIKGNQAVPGPHVGDLASPVSQEYFKRSAGVLTEYLEAVPELVAVDPHPEYFSNGLAREMDAPVEEIFHHHAHAVSLLFEHGVSGPAVFAIFDGTGYGTDGTIWGGEFLLADAEAFSRVAHLGVFRLPGGEAAIREPVRVLASLLAQAGAGELSEEFLPFMGHHRDLVPLWLEAMRKEINSPLTSSAGRLFDAAAAAAGFLRPVTFEGQAAMWLEGIADEHEDGTYRVDFIEGEPLIIDAASLIQEVALDMIETAAPARVAARFHNTIAWLIGETAVKVAEEVGITTVGLSGGCFQNKLLTERALEQLKTRGFTVLTHRSLPPNDGGIAVGQAAAAWSRYGRKPFE